MKEDLISLKKQIEVDRKLEKTIPKGVTHYVKNGIWYYDGVPKGILTSKIYGLGGFGKMFGKKLWCANSDGELMREEIYASDSELPEGCYFIGMSWYSEDENILDYVELKD